VSPGVPGVEDRLRRLVAEAFARHRLRPDGGRVLVACSGGPDSRTLLDLLFALREKLALELSVASVDHGLRPESVEEAAGVDSAARALGLPSAVLRVQVAHPSAAGARRARYEALIAHARTVGAGALAVAHTATDQAETLLDRMLRGAGLRGLSAMAPVRGCAPGLSLIRPMLAVTSSEVEEYVSARSLEVARDPTNHDRHHRRARLRHDLLPLLRRERADADRALAQLAERLRADAEALDTLASEAWARLVRDGELDVPGLLALPAALRARVLSRVCPAPLESVHLSALERLCGETHGTRRLSLPGGVVAERIYGRLRFGAPSPDPGDVALAVDRPGRFSLLGHELEVPAALLGAGPLTLRNLRPGDRAPGGKKLKEILIDRKIPRFERRRLLILARGGEVVWMMGVLGGDLAVESALTRTSAMQ
jgi:tRNA(Ile)-lysidine synthase